MPKRITDKLVFRVSAVVGAIGVGAVLATTQTGLIDVRSLLRMTDFFDLNPLW
jgi:hypothetical protein